MDLQQHESQKNTLNLTIPSKSQTSNDLSNLGGLGCVRYRDDGWLRP